MSSLKINFRTFILDILFYPIGFYLFFESFLLACLSLVVILLITLKKYAYVKNPYNTYFNGFIEFLTYLSAHLSIGHNLKYSILNFSATKSHSQHLQITLNALKKNILLNGTTDDFLKIIYENYPIKESKTFAELMRLALHSNVQSSFTVNKTLDILYLKKKMHEDADMILFQKKLEQVILCLAPLVIIIFIRLTSAEYLRLMYETTIGRGVMSLAFSLLIFMKIISDRIVLIKLEDTG